MKILFGLCVALDLLTVVVSIPLVFLLPLALSLRFGLSIFRFPIVIAALGI